MNVITSIRWNGRTVDRIDGSGGKVGNQYTFNEATVTPPEHRYSSKPYVDKITQETMTIYSIRYTNGEILRVFNPIEVSLMEVEESK